MVENIGRESARNYMGAAFPDGYYGMTPQGLAMMDTELKAALEAFGCEGRVFDKEATAFHNGEPLRQEPVMIHKWKGVLNEGAPVELQAPSRVYDTVGLKIILRGRGAIQDRVREILGNLDPDSNATSDCETYTFGYSETGSENW